MVARNKKNDTRYNKIEEDLRHRLLNGDFPEHSALPGELHLCEEYGVSRKTIRKALENLRTQHFISKEKGRGNFVIPASQRQNMPRITGKIRLLLPDGKVSGDFSREVAAGVQKYAVEHGLEVTFGSHAETSATLIEQYYNFQNDGFIWCSCQEHLPKTISALATQHIPQVVIGEIVNGTHSVEYDSTMAWRSLLNLLTAGGHRYLAFFDRNENKRWVMARRQALLKTAEEFNIKAEIFSANFEDENALADFIIEHSQFTAYVCISPLRKFFELAVKHLDKKIPVDLSWAEFTPDSVDVYSKITRIHIPAQNMGWQAVKLLVNDSLPTVNSVACFTVAGLTTGAVNLKKQFQK